LPNTSRERCVSSYFYSLPKPTSSYLLIWIPPACQSTDDAEFVTSFLTNYYEPSERFRAAERRTALSGILTKDNNS
jgi:hypothetical protein